MAETSFRFKQFTIVQNKSAMKVSTDAVLLGSWVSAENSKNILDIGTGTGVIAIMLAQKFDGQIDAIEIDPDSAEEARENADKSPWGKRIKVICSSLQHFARTGVKKYDLIVSNPPYFENTRKKSVNAKIKAKHTDSLSYADLIKGVKELLSEKGNLIVILPSQEGETFGAMAYLSGLYCREKLHVITKRGKAEKRVLMKFSMKSGPCLESEIIMQDEKLNYTSEFTTLTGQFYPD